MKYMKVLLILCMVLVCGCTEKKTEISEDISFHAIVTSDLHYTQNGGQVDTVVPGMAYVQDITDAVIAEVLAVHPDVFIMTGDNTNGGDPQDEKALSEKLRKVVEAGIPVVMTTGNHDYNQSDMQVYASNFNGLLEKLDEDDSSQSYVSIVNDVVLLAMDDGAVDEGQTGTFSKETMQWLKTMLKKYKGHRIIFLSHRSVLPVLKDMEKGSYQISNEDLIDLLKKYDVQLVLSGHTHSASVLEDSELHEIISSMPANGDHRIGFVDLEGNNVEYHSEVIDFGTYGRSGLKEDIEAADEQSWKNSENTFRKILSSKEYSKEETEGILSCIRLFMQSYEEGTLADHLQEIQDDPYYAAMIEALYDKNYGPWMESVMENPPLPSTRLFFVWN
ncbi:MAG: metallophosphoesterase [Bulleidia sp.]|nr:metallophosphoesterase [Bulleidia sp.]